MTRIPPALRLCLIATLLAWAGPGMPKAHAQETAPSYVHTQWTVEDGLPVNAINHIGQTRDGYLCLATHDGLVRFDGVHFTVFNTANSPGLPSNRIYLLFPAVDSSLWIQTEQRQVVHLKDGVFTAYGQEQGFPYTPLDLRQNTEDGLASNQVMWLHEDRLVPGRLWFQAGEQLHRYADGVLTQISTPFSLAKAFQEPSGRWWLASENALYRSVADDPAHLIRIDALQVDKWDPQLDAQGRVWVNGLTRLFQDGNAVFSRQNILHYYPDREGNIWIGTEQEGLHRLKPALFWTYGHDEGLRDANVYPILEDRMGAIWLGTITGEVARITGGVLTSYLPEATGVPGNKILSLHEDRTGNLRVGTSH